MKEYEMDLAQTLIHVQERRSIVNPNKGFIKQLEVYEGMLGAIRLRRTYYGRISHMSKSESSLVQSSNSDQLSNDQESSNNIIRLAQEHPFTSVNVKAMSLAFSNAFLSPVDSDLNEISSGRAANIIHIRPVSEQVVRMDRPKSWSPNETMAEFLFPSNIDSERGHGNTGSSDFLATSKICPTTTIVHEGKNEKLFTITNINRSLNNEFKDNCLPTECTCFNDLAQNCGSKYSKVINESEPINSDEGTIDHGDTNSSSNYAKVNRDTSSDNTDTTVQVHTVATTPTKYQQITIPKSLPSPVNSSNNAYNPDCDCNVEVELNVPEEPVKILDTHPDTHTDTIVQNLANVPLQLRSSPLLEKHHQLRFNLPEKEYAKKQSKIKEQKLARPNRSFSHPPIINSSVNNLISHYYPTPYLSNTSNSNARNTTTRTTSFNTSITSSTSSLASLLSTSSSPATPTVFTAPSSGVLRRSSAAGDFSINSTFYQKH